MRTYNNIKVIGFAALLVCLMLIFSSSDSYAQDCDYLDGEDIILNNTGNTVAPGVETMYVLTDMVGVIIESSATSTFSSPGVGDFIAYAVNYDSGQATPALAVDDDINDVIGTDCVDTASLPLSVCLPLSSLIKGCNYIDGQDITLTNTGNNITPDVLTTYVLTNSVGIIVMSSATSTFSSPGTGDFIAYAVNYDLGQATPALAAGDDINDVMGMDCVDTAALPIKVCRCAIGSELGDTEILFSLTGETPDALYMQEFVLTDGMGSILQTQTANPITNLSNSNELYNVYSLIYDIRPTLRVGDNINDLDLSEVCGDISEPLTFSLCPKLPVELMYFKGSESGCEAHLSWATASEVNVSHFEVQESFNGLEFATIDRIDAIGNETTETDYAYIDRQILNTNYYRLKIIDTDGSFEYSNIITIQADCSFGVSISDVFPNPVSTGLISVRFNSDINHENALLVLTDVLGRRLMEVPSTIFEGTNIVSIDPSGLPSATYMLHIQGKDWRTAYVKFVKLEK